MSGPGDAEWEADSDAFIGMVIDNQPELSVPEVLDLAASIYGREYVERLVTESLSERRVDSGPPD